MHGSGPRMFSVSISAELGCKKRNLSRQSEGVVDCGTMVL